MRTSCFMAGLIWACMLAGPLNGDIPGIEPGVYIYDGSLPLEVAGHSTPTVVDWNNDGRKDLVVGQFTYGLIRVFLNQGTDLNPVFNGGTLLESNGIPIATTYD